MYNQCNTQRGRNVLATYESNYRDGIAIECSVMGMHSLQRSPDNAFVTLSNDIPNGLMWCAHTHTMNNNFGAGKFQLWLYPQHTSNIPTKRTTSENSSSSV